MATCHPGGLGQAEQHRAIEAAPAAEVDVFDHGVAAQLGRLEIAGQAPPLPLGELAVDEQPEALLEAEPLVGGRGGLFGHAGGHGRQLEGVEALNGLVVEHVVSFHR